MATPKKPLQKWKRKIKQEKASTAAIYPHYHCWVCDNMIEKGETYKSILKTTDRSITYYSFCSKNCYEKFAGKPKGKGRNWPLIIFILAAIVVGVFVVLLFLYG